MKPQFVVGVDLGQSHDYTAIVVLERAGDELHARHIERLPLGTPYPKQVTRVAEVVGSPQLERKAMVAVDGTGVGRAVVDLLRPALKPLGAPLVSIIITGGNSTSRVGSHWSVPKRDLIASAQVALQQKRLRIASQLAEAQTLVDELVAYRVKVSDDGHDSYSNGRETANDDLVLAACIATYVATKRRRGATMTHAGHADPQPAQQQPALMSEPNIIVIGAQS